MNQFEPKLLTPWLDQVQDYQVNQQSAERIGQAARQLKVIEKALGTDSLFWTEPANLDALINRQAPRDEEGADNE